MSAGVHGAARKPPRPLAMRAAASAKLCVFFFVTFVVGRLSGAGGVFFIYGVMALYYLGKAMAIFFYAVSGKCVVLKGRCAVICEITASRKNHTEITIMDGRRGPVRVQIHARKAGRLRRDGWYHLYFYPVPLRRLASFGTYRFWTASIIHR